MAEITDYFRPTVNPLTGSRHSWCDVLKSNNKHEWSPDGVGWRTDLTYETSLYYRGGSAANWPKDNVDGDGRQYLSFWGSGTSNSFLTGGCCSYSKATSSSFGKAYRMYYGPPPLVIANAEKRVTVSASTPADLAFWVVNCKQIQNTAAYIVIAIGKVADYFRPVPGRSYCEMLASSKLHEWSPDNGATWVKPAPYYNDMYLGGSKDGWLHGNSNTLRNAADRRFALSRWGSASTSSTGGCCAVMYTDSSRGFPGLAFGKEFALWEALANISRGSKARGQDVQFASVSCT